MDLDTKRVLPERGTIVKFSKLLVLALTAVMVLALVGCGAAKDDKAASTTDVTTTGTTDAAAELSGSLTVEGSDTMVNLAQAWAEDFMKANPNVMVTIKGGGSGAGVASLINGTVDFANASRNVKPEELTAGTDAGVAITENAVARDGIAVIVNSANTVKDLTTDQLGQIYRGEITDWSKVGGKPGKIVLLGRDTSSGTYEFFGEAVVGKDAKYSTTMRNMQSSQAIVDEVKGNPNAIGYVGMGYEDPAIAVLNVDGKAATVEAVKDGSYTLSRELYMDSNGAPADLAAAYLSWITSDAGQAIVETEGFVTLK